MKAVFLLLLTIGASAHGEAPAAPATLPAPSPDTHLSCTQEGQDVCKDGNFRLPPIANDEFSKAFETRRLKFIEWIKPLAFYVQGATGLPASIFITQAGVGSDWGASPAFRNNNNIFKHMCWSQRSGISGEIEMGGRKFSYKATCGTDKYFNQVGRPFKFASREDSILAYLHVLLFSPSKYYKNLQDEMKRGLKNTPPRQASFRATLGVLNYFSSDTKYLGSLQSVIQQEKLVAYDIPTCWQCMVLKAGAAQ